MSVAKVRLIATSQLLLAMLVAGGVWLALPARWLWVDLPLTALALACAAVGVGLLVGAPWAARLTRALLWLELVIGTLIVTLLCVSIAQLAGSYGPVGAGGAVLMATIALLILPYLIVLPALLLAKAQKLG